MRIQSNRDWHRLVGEHDEKCVFTDSETMMVPATNEQLALVIEDWNRRAQPAEAEGVEVVAWGWECFGEHVTADRVQAAVLQGDGVELEPLMTVAQHNRILSAWQRTQAAGVPDVSAMARVLCDRSADGCNVDRDDNWAVYGQEYIEDVQAMLAAALGASTGQEVKP